jgi:hypothetical protein
MMTKRMSAQAATLKGPESDRGPSNRIKMVSHIHTIFRISKSHILSARRFSSHLALSTSGPRALGLDPLLLVLGLGLAHLLPEQVLGVRPDLGALPLGELEERGDKVLAELFRGFSGELE